MSVKSISSPFRAFPVELARPDESEPLMQRESSSFLLAKASAPPEKKVVTFDRGDTFDSEGSFSLEDAVKEITQDDYSRTQKSHFMRDWADLYNHEKQEAHVKAAVLTLFESARNSESPDVFYAGMKNVALLKNPEMMKKYLSAYLKHVAKEDEIGKDGEMTRGYEDFLRKYIELTGKLVGAGAETISIQLFGSALKRVTRLFPDWEDFAPERFYLLLSVAVANEDLSKIDSVVATFTNLLLKEGVSRNDLLWTMNALVILYNDKEATPPVKEAILRVFENVRESGKREPFYAGFYASQSFKGEGQGEMVKYLLTFAKYRADKNAVAQVEGMTLLYSEAVGQYVESQKDIGVTLTAQDAEAALQRLSVGLNLEKIKTITPLELIVRLLMEIIPQTPARADEIAAAVANNILKSDADKADKSEVLQALAALHGSASVTPEQKTAVVKVFERMTEGDDVASFYAGMERVSELGDGAPKMEATYLSKFATHVGAGDSIGTDDQIRTLVIARVSDVTKKHPEVLYPVIGDFAKAWIQKTDDPILFMALMDLSRSTAECEVPVPPPSPPAKPGETPVAPSVPPQKVKIASTVDTQLSQEFQKQTNEAKKIAAQQVTHNLSFVTTDVAPLHAKWIDKLAVDGSLDVERGVLAGLRDLNPQGGALVPVAMKTYFSLGNSLMDGGKLRDDAITQGVDNFNLDDLAVGHLTDADEGLRNLSHHFLRDSMSIREGKKSPLSTYGVRHIAGVEEVLKRAKADEKTPPAILAQCQTTLDILYQEYRKQHGIVSIGLEGVPANAIDQKWSDSPMKRSSLAGVLDVTYWTPENNGFRKIYGGRIEMGDGLRSIAARGGIGMELTEKLAFSATAILGYLSLFGTEDDRPLQVPVNVGRPDTTHGVYHVKTKLPEILFQGALIAVRPEIGYNLKRWQLGEGDFLDLDFVGAFEFGMFGGQLSDRGCSYAVNPLTGKFAGSVCRDKETAFGEYLSANIGPRLRF